MNAWQRIWQRIPRVIRWSIVDAVLLAGGAALYGTLFGGFEAAVHHEPGRVLGAMGCFALGGLLTGAILGLFGALIDSPEPAARAAADLNEFPASRSPVRDNLDRPVPSETARRGRETYLNLRAASILGSHHFRM
jgi:hypothetical protein